jgi:hypothetical protein
MPGSYGQPIVDLALYVRRTHPEITALYVLDVAMEGHRNTHPDFEVANQSEFDDWLCPPSPFAELLREAFDPELQQEDLQLMVTHDVPATVHERVRAIEERWEKVIQAFGVRYGLWQ